MSVDSINVAYKSIQLQIGIYVSIQKTQDMCVINDHLGQINNDHYLHAMFLLFCDILKIENMDGKHM